MTFILDVAAGVLVAAAVIGAIFFGLLVVAEDSRVGGNGAAGWLISAIGLILWIGLIVCRLLRWP